MGHSCEQQTEPNLTQRSLWWERQQAVLVQLTPELAASGALIPKQSKLHT